MDEKDFKFLIDELLKYEENEWIEFKHNNWRSQEIGEYISCLSNSACFHKKKFAYLVFGIDNETLNIVGTDFDPKEEKGKGNEDLEPWLKRLLNPRIDFEIIIEKYNQKNLVVFKIDSARFNPVKFNGVAYIRIDSYKKNLADYPEKEKKLWEIINYNIFEDGIALEKLSEGKILELLDYPSYFSLMHLELPDRNSILDKFLEEGLISKIEGQYAITNLGAILFAKNLDNFSRLARKKLRIIFYEGKNRINTTKEKIYSNGYAIAFYEAWTYILDQLPSNEIIEKALREKREMYPKIAIRELLANVLIHQDFSERGTGPMVELFSNRAEFTNPGEPLINPSRFIDYAPKSRNEKLASFMRRINVCEERGSGVDKVIHSVEFFQLPAPEFFTDGNFMKVILYSHKEFKDMTKEDKIRAGYQHCAIKYVSREYMANKTLRERFNLKEEEYVKVSKIIRDCVDAGLIKRDDSGRYIPFWA